MRSHESFEPGSANQMRQIFLLSIAIALVACQKAAEPPAEPASSTPPPPEPQIEENMADSALARVLGAQDESVKARYQHRHPAETLAFFQVEPGMTVVEALPGGGWYSAPTTAAAARRVGRSRAP